MKLLTATTAALLLSASSAFAEIQVSGSMYHTLVVDNGNLMGIGGNHNGQLGLDPSSLSTSNTAQDVDLHVTVTKAATGVNFSIILDDNGIFCLFGADFGNQPTPVSGLSGATDIAANDQMAFALINGVVYSGFSLDGSDWEEVPGMNDVLKITAAGNHLVAITTTGEVLVHGSDEYGELGIGYASHLVEYAFVIPNLPKITKASTGPKHTMLLDEDGNVWTMGSGNAGRLGVGYYSDDIPHPTQVPNLTDVTDISAGYNQSLSVKSDGTVWVWGWHNYVNDEGVYNRTPYPVTIKELSGIKNVHAGGDQSFVSTDSTLFSWGGNTYGKLGLGDNKERHAPDVTYVTPIDEELVLAIQQCDTPEPVEPEVVYEPRDMTIEEMLAKIEEMSRDSKSNAKAFRHAIRDGVSTSNWKKAQQERRAAKRAAQQERKLAKQQAKENKGKKS